MNKRHTIVLLIMMICFRFVEAQDNTLYGTDMGQDEMEQKADSARKLLDELFELRILTDALGMYYLTNINHLINGNKELRDSIISLTNTTNICFSVKDTLAYDHFWSFICNTTKKPGYKSSKDEFSDYLEALDFDSETYLDKGLYKAGYDLRFNGSMNFLWGKGCGVGHKFVTLLLWIL